MLHTNKKVLIILLSYIIVNIFVILTSPNWQNILFANSLLYIGLYDYFAFIIPDLGIIAILLIAFFNFESINLLYMIIIFLITFYYWRNGKMGFGDVKLLSVLSLLLGIYIFPLIIISTILIILSNKKKAIKKVPLGFYIMLSTFILYIFRGFYNTL
ncbi:prepilin peptidase [Petrotoga sibirica]